MDNLTHTLVGAVMADAGLKKRTPLAATTLMIAANLPDLDILAYAHGADAALAFRRGWTHGVVGLAVLPMLLAGAMVLVDRRRRRGGHAGPPARPGQLLLLAYLGAFSHPALDWLNTYGVRFLMPFDGTWFYGDTLYIIDPWLWLLLGGACFLGHSRDRRSLVRWGVLAAMTTTLVLLGTAAAPGAQLLWILGLGLLYTLRVLYPVPVSGQRAARLAQGALATAGLYVVLMLLGSARAEREIRSHPEVLRIDGIQAMLVGPAAARPFARQVVFATPEAYHFGTYDFLSRPRFHLDAATLTPVGTHRASADTDRAVQAALAAPCLRGMVGWARFPWAAVAQDDEGYVVQVMDARYVRRPTEGFGGSRVRLQRDFSHRCGEQR